MATVTKEQRAGVLASSTQAEAARILNTDGRTFRNGTRSRLGVFVSHTQGREGAWDMRTRAFRLALHEAQGNTDATRAIMDAWKGGADAPPTLAPAPASK
jgi:hypothetical protein